MRTSRTSTFLKGLSVQTVFTFIMAVLEIVVFALMSRLLSKTDFGYFAALAGVMTIFQSISEAGLGAAVIQKKIQRRNSYLLRFTLVLDWEFSDLL